MTAIGLPRDGARSEWRPMPAIPGKVDPGIADACVAVIEGQEETLSV